MPPPPVNRETNAEWLLRVHLVDDLVHWVHGRLSGKSSAKTREKAGQYVYAHLALGKMIYPLNPSDPLFSQSDYDALFTVAPYDDEQMREQIKSENYAAFREQVALKQREIARRRGDLLEATWDSAIGTLSRTLPQIPQSALDVLQGLQNELCARRGIRGLMRLGVANDEFVNQEMIGLVLRGRCIGAFDDNLHGSVPSKWEGLLGDYVECFASPFNHKFRHFFSMFDEDMTFGSYGNFFAMVDRKDGVLPSGSYQMNPMWMNAMFEHLARILEHSIECGSVINAVIVAPEWKDAPFQGMFNKITKIPQYSKNSVAGTRRVSYVHDLKRRKFQTNTSYWIFTQSPVPRGLVPQLFN